MEFSIDYKQLMVLCVISCTVLCALGVVFGAVYRTLGVGMLRSPNTSFYPGVSFPRLRDQVVAAIYTVGYAYLAIHQLNSGSTSGEQPSFWMMLANIIIQNALSLPILLMMFFIPSPSYPKLTVIRALPMMILGLAAVVFFSFVLEWCGLFNWMQRAFHCPKLQDVAQTFSNSTFACQVLICLSACILAPIVEECFFRGFLYSTLRRWSGPMVAALCSSFFFASVHGALLQFIPLTIFALVQCILYERYRTLWVPIIFHATFNALNLFLLRYAG